jgi:hypothetical protein
MAGIDATTDLFAFVATIPAEINWTRHCLRRGFGW